MHVQGAGSRWGIGSRRAEGASCTLLSRVHPVAKQHSFFSEGMAPYCGHKAPNASLSSTMFLARNRDVRLRGPWGYARRLLLEATARVQCS